MEIQMKLKVSAHDFYTLLIQSLINDIQNVTHHTITEQELLGYRYKKKSTQRKGSMIKVHVKKLLPDQEYLVHFTTSIDKSILHYQLTSIDEKHCLVTYTEESSRFDQQELPASSLRAQKRRAKKMIKAIEQSIIKNSKSKQ